MLNADGLLPPGRIRVTVDQVKVMFVDAFPDSATRPALYQAWVRHRQAVEAVVPIVAQWVNGSYVTSKVDPADVDVVTLINPDLADALDPGSIAILGSLTDGPNTRNTWGVDSYVIPVVGDGHPMATACRRQQGYWIHQWSRVRGNDAASKGFLEVTA